MLMARGDAESHEHWQSTFSELWLKRWVERHHPWFAMAHVFNPMEVRLDPMSSQDINLSHELTRFNRAKWISLR